MKTVYPHPVHLPIHRFLIFSFIFILVFIVITFISPVQSATPSPLTASSLVVPGQLVVKWGTDAHSELTITPNGRPTFKNLPSLNRLLVRYQVSQMAPVFEQTVFGEVAMAYGLERIYLLNVPASLDIWQVAAEFNTNPHVVYAEPVYLAQSQGSLPNDPLLNQQYGPVHTNAYAAWEINTGSSETVIALLDTGLDYTHEDLTNKVDTLHDWDFLDDDDDAQEDPATDHGTSVASIAGAETNNGLGMAGICWECTLLPVRVGGDNTLPIPGIPPVVHYKTVEVAEGIVYATDQGAPIINMSFGGQCSDLWSDAINYAYDSGVAIVAAAGNIVPFVVYPAKYERVLAASATNSSGQFDGFSSYGPEVDIAAPGIDIMTARFNDGYAIGDGTSYASPHVAGTLGLMFSYNPNLTNAQAAQIIRDTATDLGDPGFDNYYGYGLLNAGLAVKYASTPPANPSTPPPDVCGCILEQTFSQNGPLLDNLRHFRDQFLLPLPYGQHLTKLYYRHSAQVAGLLVNNPNLAGQLLNLLDSGEPLLLSVVEGNGQATLTSEFIGQVEAMVNQLAELASPELERDLRQTWETLNLRAFENKPVADLLQTLDEE